MRRVSEYLQALKFLPKTSVPRKYWWRTLTRSTNQNMWKLSATRLGLLLRSYGSLISRRTVLSCMLALWNKQSEKIWELSILHWWYGTILLSVEQWFSASQIATYSNFTEKLPTLQRVGRKITFRIYVTLIGMNGYISGTEATSFNSPGYILEDAWALWKMRSMKFVKQS